MGLDPNLLNSLPDTLVEMYGAVEADILKDMARRISTYDYFIPAALHQNQKLQELGMLQKDIIKKLSSITGQTQQELVDLLSMATAEAVEDDVEYYTRAEVYEPSKINTEALHKQLNSGLLQTEQSFFNITKTTANTASKQFEKALDRAWTQINTGGMDYQAAIRKAITYLSDAGIGSIEYSNGRIDNIEVAVRRAVVTGANQTAIKTQEVLADELEVDLVEVTAHGGARPAHAKWQGKVYSRNGRKEIDGVVYEDLKKATGYGRADGLCGINCRHAFHPYVHGTERAYSKKDLRSLDKKKIKYNGETYTEYEASQIQRRIEREIRKQKRTVEALKAAGQDASAERKLLREAQKAYTDFTEQTGIRKQSVRTQIGMTKTKRVIDKVNKASKKMTGGTSVYNNRLTDKVNSDIMNKIDNNISTENKQDKTLHEVFGFKTISNKHTIKDDIGNKKKPICNPHFNEKNPLYEENCGYCSVAYEMRRRGYNVEANPSGGMYISEWENLFKDADILTITASEATAMETVSKGLLERYENGSRGSIFVQWKNRKKGHFFSWEIENDKIRYIDGQTGTIDASGYFEIINPNTIITARWDNAEPTEAVGNACKNKDGE